MKASEFKLNLVQGVNSLVDDYFGANTYADKFINSTLKILIKQNTYRLDDILEFIADGDGMIDECMIIDEYSKIIGDNGYVLDLRDMIKNEFIKSILPNKALIIKKDDIRKLFTHG
jgi:hypothetical protein